MRRSFTTEQVLAAESVTLQRFGQQALMQRAAWAVAGTALSALRGRPGRIPGKRVALLVGVGNNGGDALFAGAILARRGVGVTAILTNPARAHPGGLAALRQAGGRVLPAGNSVVGQVISGAAVVIDGVVGLGVQPPLRGPAVGLIELANDSEAIRIAVDLPSGVDPDGAPAGSADVVFRADLTVTFGGVKTGLLLSANSGRIILQDLDFPLGEAESACEAISLEESDVQRLLPQGQSSDTKYSSGVVGIAAGSRQYPGAAVLCTGGAVRTRPGMVRFAGGSAEAVLARWPEVVSSRTVPEAGRVQAWVVGPGLGVDGSALGALSAVLTSEPPALVDADALTLVAQNPDMLARRHTRGRITVLTPHAGEFARLFPDIDLGDRLTAARTAAARTGTVVLLKGHRTIISDGSRTAINLTGSPWLASAGSGDVLSGVIGSLLAAGIDPFEATALGAYLHGRAGERAEAAGRAGAQQLWEYLR